MVIGTSTNAERRARLTEYGADLALDTKACDLGGSGDESDRHGRRPDRRSGLGRRDERQYEGVRQSSGA